MPSYLMLFFTNKELHRVHIRNYTLDQIEIYIAEKATSSLQDFINFLSRPESIGFVVFVCLVSVIGVFGEYMQTVFKM